MLAARHRRKPILKCLVAAIVCILLYGLSQKFYLRQDMTRDRLHSLNEPTITLLRKLDTSVNFHLFISKNLPNQFQPLSDFIQSLVEEYRVYGAGKVTVSYSDPGADLEAVETAYQMGVNETMANIAKRDRMEAVSIWFALAISCDGQTEPFPALQSIENFELEITAALSRLTYRQKPKICLLGPTYADGQGITFDVLRELKPIYAELAQLFDVTQIRLAPETELDLSPFEAVFVWSLHHFTEPQLYVLDQYLMGSGSIVLLASNLRIDPLYLTAHTVPPSRADAFYEHLGFRINRDLVCDMRNTKIKYTGTKPPVLESYPLFPEIDLASGDTTAEHASVAGLKTLVLPWPSSLEILPREGIRTAVIGRTSAQAWLQVSPWQINPKKLVGPTTFNQFPIGLALSGRFDSFFDAPPGNAVKNKKHVSRCNNETTLLVWSSEHSFNARPQQVPFSPGPLRPRCTSQENSNWRVSIAASTCCNPSATFPTGRG